MADRYQLSEQAVRRLAALLAASGPSTGSGQAGQRPSRAGTPTPGTILVRNTTGATLNMLGVVGLDSPLWDPDAEGPYSALAFASRPAFNGVVPQEGTHDYGFAIMTSALEDGGLGMAWAAGVCPARLTIGAAWHTAARLVYDGEGLATLTSDAGGPLDILWKPAGTGTNKPAIIAFRGRREREFYCVMSASWSPSQDDVNIMAATPCVGIEDNTPLDGAVESSFKIFAGSASPLNVRISAGDIFPYIPVRTVTGYIGILQGVQELPSGGEQYQVLTLDADNQLIVDWARYR